MGNFFEYIVRKVLAETEEITSPDLFDDNFDHSKSDEEKYKQEQKKKRAAEKRKEAREKKKKEKYEKEHIKDLEDMGGGLFPDD